MRYFHTLSFVVQNEVFISLQKNLVDSSESEGNIPMNFGKHCFLDIFSYSYSIDLKIKALEHVLNQFAN
jgi:hypothetical protein